MGHLSTRYCVFQRYLAENTVLNVSILPPTAAKHTNVAFRLDGHADKSAQTSGMVPRTMQKHQGIKWECGKADPIRRSNATAAPATVCGECFATMPLGNREGRKSHRPASQETSHAQKL